MRAQTQQLAQKPIQISGGRISVAPSFAGLRKCEVSLKGASKLDEFRELYGGRCEFTSQSFRHEGHDFCFHHLNPYVEKPCLGILQRP